MKVLLSILVISLASAAQADHLGFSCYQIRNTPEGLWSVTIKLAPAVNGKYNATHTEYLIRKVNEEPTPESTPKTKLLSELTTCTVNTALRYEPALVNATCEVNRLAVRGARVKIDVKEGNPGEHVITLDESYYARGKGLVTEPTKNFGPFGCVPHSH
jgi:hypothetical protein